MTRLPSRAGVGVRTAHYAEVLAHPTDLAWCEVHSENFFAEGGPAIRLLDTLAERHPLSFHGVGLGLGDLAPLETTHLAALQRLVARYQPAAVSEHLCWSGHGGWHSNDLLPLPYTEEAVDYLAHRVATVQDVLGRQILVENVSCYVRFHADRLSEWEFAVAVCERAGCALLLDVNNIHVNASNHGYDARAFLNGIPRGLVQQIHLAGFTETPWGLVDSHSAPVAPAVWALYAEALERFGPLPTLIEWDHALPPFADLLAEAQHAQRLLDAAEGARAPLHAAPRAHSACPPAPSAGGPAAPDPIPASADSRAPPPGLSASLALESEPPRSGAAGLARLQEGFADFLRAGDGGVPAGLLTQIIPGPVASPERLRIYWRITRHAQRSALESVYPVLRALIGADLFAALAADYIAQPGSRSGDLHTFGEAFGQSVLAEPACAPFPYLGDVA